MRFSSFIYLVGQGLHSMKANLNMEELKKQLTPGKTQ